jgi:hypothetical protein
MITLPHLGPFFGLPDASPFVMKAEMLLAGSALTRRTRRISEGAEGKLLYIEDGGSSSPTPRSSAAPGAETLHLLRPRAFARIAAAWAVDKMLEDHLY